MRTAGERRVNTGICMKEQEEGKPYKLSCADRVNGAFGGGVADGGQEEEEGSVGGRTPPRAGIKGRTEL